MPKTNSFAVTVELKSKNVTRFGYAKKARLKMHLSRKVLLIKGKILMLNLSWVFMISNV